MPVRRRMKGRAKRSFKGRRRTRSRIPRQIPDGSYTEKLTYETELVPLAATLGQAYFSFSWVRTAPNAPGPVNIYYACGSNQGNTQFAQCAAMFKSYKVMGLKLEYRPYFFSSGPNAISLRSLAVGTTMDVVGAYALPAPRNTYRAALDFKEYNPQRAFKRYYHIARWASGKEINWRTTREATANAYGNNTPDCVTNVNMDVSGFAAGTPIGIIKATWYVKFKERNSD